MAWEYFTNHSRELHVSRSIDDGVTFSAPVAATGVFPTGDGGALQGGIRTNEFPGLAVDRSGGPANGTLYMTWNDGRFIRPPDVESLTGRYGYAQVLVIKSTDGGVSWSSPVRVNDDRLLALPSGRGVDHFIPAAGVDNTGRVGICWYDRRNSPINLFVSRFCAVSTDGANTWNNQGIPGTWLPYKSADAL